MLNDRNYLNTILKMVNNSSITNPKKDKYESICTYIQLILKEEYIEYLANEEIDKICKELEQEIQQKKEEINKYESKIFIGMDLEKDFNLKKQIINNEILDYDLKVKQIFKNALKQYIKNMYKSTNKKQEEFYINQIYNRLYQICKKEVRNIKITGMSLNSTDTGKLLNKNNEIDFKIIEAFINIFYDKDLEVTAKLIYLNKDKKEVYYKLQLLDIIITNCDKIIENLTKEVINDNIIADEKKLENYLNSDLKKRYIRNKLKKIDKKFEKQLNKLDNPTEEKIEKNRKEKEDQKLNVLIESKSPIIDDYDRKQKLEKLYGNIKNKNSESTTCNEINDDIKNKLKEQINEVIKENINIGLEELKEIIKKNIFSKAKKHIEEYIEQLNGIENKMSETIDDYNQILKSIIVSNNISQIWLNEELIENLHLLILINKVKENRFDKNLLFEFLDKKEQEKTRIEVSDLLLSQINEKSKQKTIGGTNE